MEQSGSEKRLTIIYTLCAIAGATASITTGIAWGHWKPTLDQCVNNRNCSCILYGEHTPSKFLGGHAAPCAWVTFGPIAYILFCISLSCFHGYRVLFSSRSTTTRSVMTKTQNGEMIEMRAIQVADTSTLPRLTWIIFACFTVFFAIYSLVHFAVFLGGFERTCNQYRKTLETLLGVHGTAIPVIHGRLSCQGVFDFMDYMQPDSGNAYRDGFIFTGIDLIIGIVASFAATGWFVYASIINIQLCRKREV